MVFLWYTGKKIEFINGFGHTDREDDENRNLSEFIFSDRDKEALIDGRKGATAAGYSAGINCV